MYQLKKILRKFNSTCQITFSLFRTNVRSPIEPFIEFVTILCVIWRHELTDLKQRIRPLWNSMITKCESNMGRTLVSLYVKQKQFSIGAFSCELNFFHPTAFLIWIDIALDINLNLWPFLNRIEFQMLGLVYSKCLCRWLYFNKS